MISFKKRVVVFLGSALFLSCAAAKSPQVESVVTVPPSTESWTVLGEENSYPRSAYLVGKGYSHLSAEEAKRKAVVDVERQISVMIKSVDQKHKREVVNRGASWEWEDNTHFSRLRTKGNLEGVEIVRETKQPDGWHALAALDREAFASRTGAEIELLEREIVQSLDQAQEWLQKNDPSAALSQMEGVREKMEQRDLLWVRLSAVNVDRSAEIQRRSVAELESLGGKIASAVEVKLISGKGQSAEVGMPLPEPLILAVTVSGRPAARVPVALLSDDGRTVLETRLSDSEGRVEWQPVGRLSGASGEWTLRMGLRLPVDAAWRKLLMERDLNIAYSIRSVSLPVRWKFEGVEALRKDVSNQLKGVGVEEHSTADALLRLRQEKVELGRLQGLRDETISLQLHSIAELLDGKGRLVASCTTSAKGYGSSETTALRHAVGQTKWGKVAVMVRGGLGVAQSVPRLRLALMPVEGDRGEERLAASFGDLLLGVLMNRSHYTIVERYRLNEVIAEQGLSAIGATETTVELGRLVGAEQLLFLSLKKVQGEWSCQARIVDVESGRVVTTATANQPARQSLSSLAAKIGKQLSP